MELVLVKKSEVSAVYKCINHKTGAIFYTKRFENKDDDLSYTCLLESYIPLVCHHPNIVSITNIINHQDHVDISMPDYGVALAKLKHLTFTETKKIFKQLVTAVCHIHSMGFIHTDIKPANVIINPDNHHVTLIDFGTSLPSTRWDPMLVQTVMCRAPEIVNNESFTESIDVWGLGCCLYYMLCSEYPINLSSEMPLKDQLTIFMENLSSSQTHIKSKWRNIIKMCLCPVENRSTIFDICRHLFHVNYPIYDNVEDIIYEVTDRWRLTPICHRLRHVATNLYRLCKNKNENMARGACRVAIRMAYNYHNDVLVKFSGVGKEYERLLLQDIIGDAYIDHTTKSLVEGDTESNIDS